MPPKEDSETAKLRQELKDLINKIQEAQKSVSDAKLEDACSGTADAPRLRLGTKRYLKGHINKVNAVHFSGDSRHVVSGSLDGKLIIWDAWTGNKQQVIPLRSSWVMSAAFAPSGNYVACGGMDNMCTVYDVNNRDSTGVAKVMRELSGYDGFLSSCRFIDDKHVLTGSGDMKIVVWDIEAGKRTNEFFGHEGDVVTMSMSPDNSKFVTGSVDKSIKLWDLRDNKCLQTFWGHESDVNSVCFHPSGFVFGTGSEDKSSRLFDIRSDQQVGLFKPPTPSGLTSCGLTKSGRYIMCGSDDATVHMWDTLKGQHTGNMSGHETRITSLSINEAGFAVATASWDQSVRIWG